MKLLGVVLAAVALLVFWLICGSGPGGDSTPIESLSSGSQPDLPGLSDDGDKGVAEAAVPGPAQLEPPRQKPVAEGTEEAAPPRTEQQDAEFEFLKSLDPATRTLVESSGCGAKIDGLLRAMSYTPNPQSLGQIASVMVEVERSHAARLAALDRERYWDLSDPKQAAERRRRELELAAGYREEQYESLQKVIPPQVLVGAFEKMGASDPDDER